jgi:hypothetical protein
MESAASVWSLHLASNQVSASMSAAAASAVVTSLKALPVICAATAVAGAAVGADECALEA